MISAVILSHNDEQIILRALGSVSWCDERIVIDDNSRDRTCELALQHGAKVYTHALGDDFAKQRNFGMDKAKGDWVLFLDSDEEIPTALAKEIQQELKNPQNSICGYLLKRKDFFAGKWLEHGETNRVTLVRLAQRKMGKWTRPIHEVWEVKGQLKFLKEPILHYPHPSVFDFIKEINKYSTVNARYLFSQNTNVPSWQIVIYPLAKFIKNYIFLGGFLDGTVGAIVAILMSFHSFLTRAKLYVLYHPSKPIPVS